jgi:hypothetical protein
MNLNSTDPVSAPWWKQLLPALGASFVMLLAAILFFWPLMQGKVLKQYDMIQLKGMQKDVMDYRETHPGDDALWITTMFSGMPATTIHQKTSGNIIRTIRTIINLGLPEPVGTFFWGMVGTFLLLRVFGVSLTLALAGGLAFGFYSYYIIITEAGHVTKAMALMYAPGVLAGVAYTFRHRVWLGAALTALAVGFEVFSSHPQMTYYLLFILLSYGIYEAIRHIREKQLPRFFLATGLLLASAGIGAGISISTLMPLQEYTQYSIRGPSELQREPGTPANQVSKTGLDKEYAYNWSNSKDELLTLLIPNAKGGGGSSYWGLQPFTSGPTYAGAVVVVLCLVALCLAPTGLKWAFFYPIVLFIGLSLGANSFTIPQTLVLFGLPLVYEFTKQSMEGKLPLIYYGALLGVGGLVVVMLLNPADPMQTYKLKDLFFDYLPVYNKFRAPASILSMAGPCFAVLAILGAHALLSNEVPKQEKIQALVVSGGSVALVCLVLIASPELIANRVDSTSPEKRLVSPFSGPSDNSAKSQMEAQIQMALRTGQLSAQEAEAQRARINEQIQALVQERKDLLTSDATRSLLFAIATVVLLFLAVNGTLKDPTVVGGILAFLIAIDLFVVDKRYLSAENYVTPEEMDSYFTPYQADTWLKQADKDYYRVYPLSRNAFNDGKTPYTLRTIGGYSPAKLKRYQQLIEAHISKLNFNVINMLNTRYLIDDREANYPGFQLINPGKPSRENEFIYRNLMNYGPAWIVRDVLVVPTPDSALSKVGSVFTLDTAVVEQKMAGLLKPFSKDTVDRTNETVTLKSFDNKKMVYEFKSDKARFVQFSEIYYKDWKATIDGQETPVLQTNFVLRGLVVPAGNHTITFTYSSPVLEKSQIYSWACSILLVLFILGAAGLEWKNSRKV